MSPGPAGLRIQGLTVRYGGRAPVLTDVDLDVPAGSVVSVLGANGAGKTSLLRAITGLLPLHRGRALARTLTYAELDLGTARPAVIVRVGVAQVLEGRRLLPGLTVADNIRLGGWTRNGAKVDEDVLAMFPALTAKLGTPAGLLSGGEQQMVAICRALMSRPSLLLLDEPSLGLAPKMAAVVRDAVRAIHRSGTSVLLVEQNAAMALSVSDRAIVVDRGRVVREAPAHELLVDTAIRELYLGGAA